jgi:hypothetical protein
MFKILLDFFIFKKKSKFILILHFQFVDIFVFFFVGYDQPGDGYTDKNAKYGVDAPPPYQPGIPPPQQGYGQQPYPMQPQYGHNTNTTVVNICNCSNAAY